MEKFQVFMLRGFGLIVCNPEWWCYQYAPVFLAAVFN